MLNIENNVITYGHSPFQEYKLAWSSDQANKPITIDFHDFNGVVHTMTYDGAWALFKFIDSGKLSNYSGKLDTYLLDIKINDMRASFVVNMIDADKIFKQSFKLFD